MVEIVMEYFELEAASPLGEGKLRGDSDGFLRPEGRRTGK